MATVLYITYDGLLEPIGRSQVLLYLRLLAKDHSVTLLSYEKASDWSDAGRRMRLREEVAAAGIRWFSLRYHKAPSLPATAFDLGVGALLSLALCLLGKVDIVHARSDPPAVIGWALKRLLGVRFLYDMRGFWADQRADCGAWRRESVAYRLAKWFQTRFLRDADLIVSLTQAGLDFMRSSPSAAPAATPCVVIPTCTDLDAFVPESRSDGSDRPFVVGIVGSVGIWYRLEDMLDCFNALRALEPRARLLVLNRDAHATILGKAAAAGIPPALVTVKAVPHEDVPGEMRRLDAAVFLLTPVPSMAGVMPTKLGELLASGVPCLANSGIGDVEAILNGAGAGVVLRDLSMDSKRRGAEELLRLARDPGCRARCVRAARERFGLTEGVASYDAAYRTLSS